MKLAKYFVVKMFEIFNFSLQVGDTCMQYMLFTLCQCCHDGYLVSISKMLLAQLGVVVKYLMPRLTFLLTHAEH